MILTASQQPPQQVPPASSTTNYTTVDPATTLMEEYYNVTQQNKMENMYTLNNNNPLLPNGETTTLLPTDVQQLQQQQQQSGNIDEQRALQLALELSMLGLTNEDESGLNYNDLRVKKSANMTECVPVPSSEHVAEIVGRQGCKIKALRAKTNTYIKTPVRGEEPVFVVTGRKEDVAAAKREILQAAEHFSQIRASRRSSASISPLGSPAPTAPGHVTKQVRVPYRVVGLVVGPKGSTIKRIQQTTNTYIVTPSRDKEPVFEVTGLPDNVDRAKREVEQHIALRTGGIIDPTHPESAEQLLNGFGSSLFSPTSTSSTGSFSALLDHGHTNGFNAQRSHSMDSFSYLSGSSKYSDIGSATTSPFTNSAFFYDTMIPSPTTEVENAINQFDPAPGTTWPEMLPKSNVINRAPGQPTQRSLSISTYPSSSDSGRSSPAHLRRLLSESDSYNPNNISSSYSHFNINPPSSMAQASMSDTTPVIDMVKVTSSDGESQSSSPDWLANKKQSLLNAAVKKQCFVCQSNKVVAALVPCGHNLFCMDCAEQVKGTDCPACGKRVDAVLRIIS